MSNLGFFLLGFLIVASISLLMWFFCFSCQCIKELNNNSVTKTVKEVWVIPQRNNNQNMLRNNFFENPSQIFMNDIPLSPRNVYFSTNNLPTSIDRWGNGITLVPLPSSSNLQNIQQARVIVNEPDNENYSLPLPFHGN
ncbi:hypothetical protein DMUE_3486 [Dictyocoela muelleri]|nr:hypothetical protein DMUE_3486 [Dictyocoela muelleri]